MESSETFFFLSTKFEIEPGEDLDTNPGMFGKQLSTWLADRFADKGYPEPDAFPEDWGWRVDCQRRPFTLFTGCTAFIETSVYDENKDRPDAGDILWVAFAAVEKPLFAKLRGVPDGQPAFERFKADLGDILRAEPGIELVDEPQEGWRVPPPSAEFIEASAPAPQKPLSAWLSVPLGVILLLTLPIMFIALIEALHDPPGGRELSVISLALVIGIPIIWIVRLALLALLVRLDSLQRLFHPVVTRLIAVTVLLWPLWTVDGGYHARFPFSFAVQVALHSLAFAFLWWRASKRARELRSAAGTDAAGSP